MLVGGESMLIDIRAAYHNSTFPIISIRRPDVEIEGIFVLILQDTLMQDLLLGWRQRRLNRDKAKDRSIEYVGPRLDVHGGLESKRTNRGLRVWDA